MLSTWFLLLYTPIIALICGLFFVFGYYIGEGKSISEIMNDDENGMRRRIKRHIDTIMPSNNIGMPKSGVYTPTDEDQFKYEQDKEWEEEVRLNDMSVDK